MQIPFAKIEAFVQTDPESAIVMQSPWLDVEHRRLLATDGIRCMRVGISVGDGDVSGPVPLEAFQLARKELKAISKKMGKESLPDPWLRVTCAEETVCVENLLSNTRHLVERPKLEATAKFPAMDRVFPAELGAPSVRLNRIILAEILQSIDGGADVNLWVRGNDQSVLLASEDGTSASLLMVMAPGDLNGPAVLKRGAAEPASPDEVAAQVAASPGFQQAVADMVKPIAEGGIESMTISTNIPGVEPVTITQEDAQRIRVNVKKRKK